MSYSVYLVKNRAGFFLDFEHPTLQGVGNGDMVPRALPWALDLLGFQPAQGRRQGFFRTISTYLIFLDFEHPALRGLSPVKAFTSPANNEVRTQKSTLPAGGRAFFYVFLSSSLDEFLTAANINLSLLWRRDNATAEVVDDVVRSVFRVGISRDKLNVRRDVRWFDIPERRGILSGR